jgi:hypothetical protein
MEMGLLLILRSQIQEDHQEIPQSELPATPSQLAKLVNETLTMVQGAMVKESLSNKSARVVNPSGAFAAIFTYCWGLP